MRKTVAQIADDIRSIEQANWDRSPDLRAEFQTFDQYLSYKAAVQAGVVKERKPHA